ncbi:Hsp70 family protein [Leucobacter sp. GX24907]
MAGIEVGTSGITVLRTAPSQSGAAGTAPEALDRVPLEPGSLPDDLLLRIADGVPYVRLESGGHELVSVQKLYAGAIADVVHPRGLGTPDDPVAVAVPGWWSRRTVSEVTQALHEAGVSAVLVNEAEAAVAEYLAAGARGSGYGAVSQSLPDTVAVVGLRACQTSVAIVRDCDRTPVALQRPALVHGDGGKWLDRAVLRHLVAGLADLGCEVDASDPDVVAAARVALGQSQELREALSSSVSESILPSLPGVQGRVLLARTELEEVAASWVESVVGLLRTALERSPVSTDTVLLTGGLAAMPMVAQRISADLGLEVLVPQEPALVAVRGAERLRAVRVEAEAAAASQADQAEARLQRGGVWGAVKRVLRGHPLKHPFASGLAASAAATVPTAAVPVAPMSDADTGAATHPAVMERAEDTAPLSVPKTAVLG